MTETAERQADLPTVETVFLVGDIPYLKHSIFYHPMLTQTSERFFSRHGLGEGGAGHPNLSTVLGSGLAGAPDQTLQPTAPFPRPAKPLPDVLRRFATGVKM